METFDPNLLQQMFEKLKSHDNSAFETFYELTKKEVFYNILSITKDYDLAEDVMQETYISFLENIDKIDSKKSPKGYLFVISKNKALKALKSRSKSVSINSLENTEFASVEESTSKNDNYIFKKMKEILSDKEYRIVILHVLNGMSHKEIASLLHRPLGTITWAYSNAIKKLQKGLCDYYGK